MTQEFEPVIGLEIHVQLSTRSKIFCRCSADVFGVPANTNICPICSGLPGALPMLNKQAVGYAISLALALNCQINQVSYFNRKNYFYPDLPKGYQITQHNLPLARNGRMTILVGEEERNIGITKLHLEEDAGKNEFRDDSWLVDFNRCGIPLIEIVSEPDLRSPQEACEYVRQMRQMVRYLGISDGDMEKGSLRCDANLSLRPKGSATLSPQKTEIKNLNSFSYLERALLKEIDRQSAIRGAGGEVERVTLRYEPESDGLFRMRSKETEEDYRYFLEPDLLEVVVSPGWIEAAQDALPMLPLQRRRHFITQYGLTPYAAEVLTAEPEIAHYFETTVDMYGGNPTTVANWILNVVLGVLEERRKIADLPLTPRYLAEVLTLLDEGQITQASAKSVCDSIARTGREPKEIIEEQGMLKLSDRSQLISVCASVLEENPQAVSQYHGGKKQVIGFLIGQVMKKTNSRADQQLARQLLEELLHKDQPA